MPVLAPSANPGNQGNHGNHGNPGNPGKNGLSEKVGYVKNRAK